MQNRLSELRDIIHGIKSPFVCSGKYKNPDGPIKLKVNQISETLTIKPSDSAYNQAKAPWVSKLLKIAPPAPFGHGSKTVYNKNVRDALQVKAEDFELLNFDLEKSGIVSKIHDKLTPYDPDDLTAEQYSLNLYKENGHFHSHKDTPRSDKMVGTLLLFLPTRYSQGTLQVTHKGYDKSFNFGNATEEDVLHWVAFFGDVDHSVSRMWSGVRMTVAYTINRGDVPEQETSPEPTVEDETKSLIEKLKEILADDQFMPDGGKLGFPCYHLYTNGQFFKGRDSEDPLEMTQLKKLKGKDFNIALAGNHCGLDVCLQPYLGETCCDMAWKTSEFTAKKDIRRRMTDDSIPGTSLEYESDGVEWVESTPGRNSGVGKPQSKVLKDAEYSATGYFGNEASWVTFYVYAGIIINIPDFDERRANIKKAMKAFKPPKGLKRRLEVTEKTRKKSKKEITAAATNTTRLIHVTGAQGARTKVGDGTGDISLHPGWGLKELKKLIRQKFGKARCQRLGKIYKVNTETGRVEGRALASKDLVDGMTVKCEYNYAAGNPGNLFGGRRRRYGGGDDCVVS